VNDKLVGKNRGWAGTAGMDGILLKMNDKLVVNTVDRRAWLGPFDLPFRPPECRASNGRGRATANMFGQLLLPLFLQLASAADIHTQYFFAPL
jgi:hypothetical protein